jgi:nitrogen fixation NifU-like protein
MNLGSLDSLYREVVMDHHRHPRGNQPLDHCDVEASGQNPACGDEVTLQLKFTGERISGIGVLSQGCAISTSSGSMLADLLTGLTVAEAEKVAEIFKLVLHGEEIPPAIDLGDLEALTGVRKFPVRIKCALLPWVTLVDAVLAHRQGRRPQSVPSTTDQTGSEAMAVKVQEVDRGSQA